MTKHLIIWFFKSLDSVLLVDPSSRATEWLKKHLVKQKVEVVNQQVSFIDSMKLFQTYCNLFYRIIISQHN